MGQEAHRKYKEYLNAKEHNKSNVREKYLEYKLQEQEDKKNSEKEWKLLSNNEY